MHLYFFHGTSEYSAVALATREKSSSVGRKQGKLTVGNYFTAMLGRVTAPIFFISSLNR